MASNSRVENSVQMDSIRPRLNSPAMTYNFSKIEYVVTEVAGSSYIIWSIMLYGTTSRRVMTETLLFVVEGMRMKMK